MAAQNNLGSKRWVIPDGYIPKGSHGLGREFISHEAACRTLHVRFNDFTTPAPIPVATDYSTVLESDVPVIIQHTRLDSRQAENALMTTVAYADEA